VTGSRPIGSELDSTVENFRYIRTFITLIYLLTREFFEQNKQRRAVDEAVSHYTAEHYPNGGSTVYGSHDSSSHRLTICISSSRFNPGNYWYKTKQNKTKKQQTISSQWIVAQHQIFNRNGRWRSAWTASYKPGGNVTFNGTIKLNVHYYEDGNVQLNATFNKNVSFAAPSDPKAFAEAVVKQLTKLEQDYHSSLEQSYATMGETTFKALRRVLPITRQRMDWDKLKALKIGGEIGRG